MAYELGKSREVSSFRLGWIQLLKRCTSGTCGASCQGWISSWLSSGLASFSSSWVHSRGRNMAWRSSRLTSSWLRSPSRKRTPPALQLLGQSEGELLAGWLGLGHRHVSGVRQLGQRWGRVCFSQEKQGAVPGRGS